MSKAFGKTVRPRRRKTEADGERYLTMRDIAKVVGVHPTTVSMALRDHPSLPPATRDRIRAAADRLGYHRDPLLDAFNSHRVRHSRVQSSLSFAFIVDAGTSSLFEGINYHPRVYEGVRAAAEAHHSTVEILPFGERSLSAARINSIIASRGITGVLVSTFNLGTAHLQLDWGNYCAVKIESHHLLPQFDLVSSDQFLAARICLRNLRGLGYRRIGMATARDDELRLQEHYSTGVLVEQAALPESEWVPSLVFKRNDPAQVAEQVAHWVKTHRIDAIMTNWNELLYSPQPDAPTGMIATSGLRVPHDVAWASLDVPPAHTHIAGVVQNHRLVGMRALEQLAVLVKTFHRGAPAGPAATYIPGYWRGGATAPRRVG
jgi:LacI family transcriptional regulator